MKTSFYIIVLIARGCIDRKKKHEIARACSEILLVFEKIYSCLVIPKCTRNHVIAHTNLAASCHHALDASLQIKGLATKYTTVKDDSLPLRKEIMIKNI